MEVRTTRFGVAVVHTLIEAGRRATRKGQHPVTSMAVLAQLARWKVSGEAPAVGQVRLALRTDAGWPHTSPPHGAGEVWNLDGADPVSAVLREARWRLAAGRPPKTPLVRWHGSVASTLEAVLAEAREAGVERAGPTHLMIGLLDDRTGDLAGLRADRTELVESLRADPSWRQPGEPHTPLVNMLEMTEELDERSGLLMRWLGRRIRRGVVRGSRYGGTLAVYLLEEAMRQAVRLGEDPVTSAHLVLAVASLRAQLRADARTLRPAIAPFNSAPETLERHGVTLDRAVAAVPAAEPAMAIAPAGQVGQILRVTWPQWTVEAADAVDRAVALAGELGHAETGSSHLAAAALEADDSTACRLLRALGADPAAVRDDIVRGLE